MGCDGTDVVGVDGWGEWALGLRVSVWSWLLPGR